MQPTSSCGLPHSATQSAVALEAHTCTCAHTGTPGPAWAHVLSPDHERQSDTLQGGLCLAAMWGRAQPRPARPQSWQALQGHSLTSSGPDSQLRSSALTLKATPWYLSRPPLFQGLADQVTMLAGISEKLDFLKKGPAFIGSSLPLLLDAKSRSHKSRPQGAIRRVELHGTVARGPGTQSSHSPGVPGTDQSGQR